MQQSDLRGMSKFKKEIHLKIRKKNIENDRVRRTKGDHIV